jgi:GTP-binding protein
LPAQVAPEIAFCGRSNVGKSTLLNMLTERTKLVRTSRTPGCTRQINLFDVGLRSGAAVTLVDLPGYGYAKVSKKEQDAWRPMVEGYVREHRAALYCILVDLRRGIEAEEEELAEYLAHESGLEEPVVLIATKLDKMASAAKKSALVALKRSLALPVVGASGVSGEGREELWKRLLHAVK